MAFNIKAYRRESVPPTWWKPWTWFANRFTDWEQYEKVIYTEEAIKEKIADLLHNLWAEDKDSLIMRGKLNGNGTFTINKETIDMYDRLTKVLYTDLTEAEKQIYLYDANRFIELMLSVGIEINQDLEVWLE